MIFFFLQLDKLEDIQVYMQLNILFRKIRAECCKFSPASSPFANSWRLSLTRSTPQIHITRSHYAKTRRSLGCSKFAVFTFPRILYPACRHFCTPLLQWASSRPRKLPVTSAVCTRKLIPSQPPRSLGVASVR